MPNRSTKKTPFEVVYTSVPRHIVDLIRLPLSHDVNPNAEEFAEHQHQRLKLFNEGDLVMVHLRKNHFPTCTYNNAYKIGPLRVLQKIGDNAYKIDLLADINISNTFNVVDVFEYFPSDEFSLQPQNLRMSFLQVEGIDVTHNHH
ncbi:hypothetical protein CK203_037531 [Vitis vinifera]|uniref:Tf2-1-like SH3-like domain-containing protein n=1 Tax=Vitis vinifera TaxID=29760 RepID=A0A438HMC9_VITVI|nr:hypothetical protein CK203_037531 [Vitis vinifera]